MCIFIGKVVKIFLGVSVNLVCKFKGIPGTTTVKHDFNHLGLKFHRGFPWVSVLSWLNLKANKDYFSYEDVYIHVNVYIHVYVSIHDDTYIYARERERWPMDEWLIQMWYDSLICDMATLFVCINMCSPRLSLPQVFYVCKHTYIYTCKNVLVCMHVCICMTLHCVHMSLPATGFLCMYAYVCMYKYTCTCIYT